MNGNKIVIFIFIVITIIFLIFAIRNQKLINEKWKEITGNISKVSCGEERTQTVCRTHPNDMIASKKNPWRKFNDQYHNINTTTICDQHYHKVCSTNVDYIVDGDSYIKNIVKSYERPYPKIDTPYKLFYNTKTPSISVNKKPTNFVAHAFIASLIVSIISIFIPF